jgi:hypothetical protein
MIRIIGTTIGVIGLNAALLVLEILGFTAIAIPPDFTEMILVDIVTASTTIRTA